MARWLRAWDSLAMLKLWSAGGGEFNPGRGIIVGWDPTVQEAKASLYMYDDYLL